VAQLRSLAVPSQSKTAKSQKREEQVVVGEPVELEGLLLLELVVEQLETWVPVELVELVELERQVKPVKLVELVELSDEVEQEELANEVELEGVVELAERCQEEEEVQAVEVEEAQVPEVEEAQVPEVEEVQAGPAALPVSRPVLPLPLVLHLRKRQAARRAHSSRRTRQQGR